MTAFDGGNSVTFYVDPPALRSSAGKLTASAQALARCRDYHDQHRHIGGWGQGVLQNFKGEHEAFTAKLQGRISEAVRFLQSSTTSLAKAADLYEQMDAESARRVDATYEGAPRPDLDWRGR